MPETRKENSDTADTGAATNLSEVIENYLETIFRLEVSEGAAKASAIADATGVSRSAVTSALRTLRDQGFIEYSPYGPIRLTAEGRGIGRDISHRHLVFQEFFQNVLQLDPETSDKVACRLEHVVPADVTRRLGQFVLYLKSREGTWNGWQDDYVREEIAKKSNMRMPDHQNEPFPDEADKQ